MAKRNRVVVTGMGILAPNGTGLEAFWESLLAGRSGIGPITLFDATGFKSRIAGEVKNFDPLDYIEPELKPQAYGTANTVGLRRDEDGFEGCGAGY